MTIDKTPDPNAPAPEMHPAKRKMEEEESKDTTKNPKREESIASGPFKHLPVPLQQGGYQSTRAYIECNETNQEGTLKDLASHPSAIPLENRVHIGFSVWFNFDLMSVTKPSYGIVCDIDNLVIDIYQAIGECLTKSANRQGFVKNFREFLGTNAEKLFGLPSLEEAEKLFDITQELKRPGSWLASEDSFQYIKALHERGRILFLNLNITEGEGVFGKIKSWMEGRKLELDTLYASNIIEWLDPLKRQAYVRNLQIIGSPRTRFIQAYKTDPAGWPVQFLTQGVENISMPPSLLKKKMVKRI